MRSSKVTLGSLFVAGSLAALAATARAAPLPGWADQMKALEPVGERLLAKAGRGGSELERQEMYRYVLSALSEGYLDYVNMDPAHPTWAPLWNHAFNLAGPSPDYVYMTTQVDPNGVYRISGYRGTSRFVEITEQAQEMIGELSKAKPAPGTHDVDTLHIGKDGYFSVVFSAERPAGYTGDWWKLDPSTRMLIVRKASYDWTHEVDPRMAIDRLDDVAPMSAEESARRFSNLAAWIEGVINFDIDLARYYREHHGINVLEPSKIIGGIGGLTNQVYYDGTHQLKDDEALIVETAVPATCRYWSILVGDDRFATVDWVNRQSSLNGFQARLDKDGRFRAVVAPKDPGVPNWLDTAGNAWGMMQMRWNRCSEAPHPSVRKVALKNVRKYLPADTPVVSPAERKEQLRLRREGAQLRQLW